MLCCIPTLVVHGSRFEEVAGKLTDVGALNGGTGGLEAKTNILVPSAVTGGLPGGLGVVEDRLLLEGLLRLDTELDVRHGVCVVEGVGGR